MDPKVPVCCRGFAVPQTGCHSPAVGKGSSKSHFISKIMEEIHQQLKNEVFWQKLVCFLACQLVMIFHEQQ